MEETVPFRLSTLRLGEHASTITIEGELDLHSAPELKTELQSLDDEVRHVLVDLSRASFVDSAGLGVLVASARRLQARGGTLLLSVDDHNTLKALQITGLDRFFDVRRPETNPTRELVGLSLLTSLDGAGGSNRAA